MQPERITASRREYEPLNEDVVWAYCRRLAALVDQDPTSGRVTPDIMRLTREATYVELDEMASGECLVTERGFSITEYQYGRGLIKEQFELILSTTQASMEEGEDLSTYQVLYSFVVRRDNSAAAYIERLDGEPSLPPMMTMYDAEQLDKQLDHIDASHSARR